MSKCYELDDKDIKTKRVLNDFNLYGCNLNIKNKKEVDEIKLYGRTSHNKPLSIKK